MADDRPQAEVRLRNETDGLTIDDVTVGSTDEYTLGPEPHTPTTKSDPIVIKVEARVPPGGTIAVRSPVIRFGIGA